METLRTDQKKGKSSRRPPRLFIKLSTMLCCAFRLPVANVKISDGGRLFVEVCQLVNRVLSYSQTNVMDDLDPEDTETGNVIIDGYTAHHSLRRDPMISDCIDFTVEHKVQPCAALVNPNRTIASSTCAENLHTILVVLCYSSHGTDPSL